MHELNINTIQLKQKSAIVRSTINHIEMKIIL
jgi:hypothetical protein